MKINYILSFLFLYYVNNINAISSGANEPIADNELGLTAKDCALQYCTIKDGMALWLTLVNECVSNPNPYFVNIKGFNEEKEIEIELNKNYNINDFLMEKVDPMIGGFVCSIISMFGLLFGYVLGIKHENDNQYIQLSNRKNKK